MHDNVDTKARVDRNLGGKSHISNLPSFRCFDFARTRTCTALLPLDFSSQFKSYIMEKVNEELRFMFRSHLLNDYSEVKKSPACFLFINICWTHYQVQAKGMITGPVESFQEIKEFNAKCLDLWNNLDESEQKPFYDKINSILRISADGLMDYDWIPGIH